jgi:Cas7 group CRISPR-associated protein Csh2
MATDAEVLKRGTGLLVIEAVNSNPNGDPDQESDPRMRLGDIGEISPVSFKRKLRDMVLNKTGPVWQSVTTKFNVDEKQFDIIERRDRKLEELFALGSEELQSRFWDARVFGSTVLQSNKNGEAKEPPKSKGKKVSSASFITTGVVQFGLGISVAPVEIQRHTWTNISPVQEGKSRAMAPLGYRIVQHGVYTMPFFINPAMAGKSGCTPMDINVLLHLIPYAYSQTASCMRPDMRIRRAWYMQHKSALGSCPDYMLLEALQPVKKADADKPSRCWEDYEVPSDLPAELKARIEICTDLVKPLAAGA